MKFTVFPKEWGIYLSYNNYEPLEDGDIEMLNNLRKALEHKHGQIIEYKWDIRPLEGVINWSALRRLWKNDMIFKFAKQLHTQSERPEYIRWWIWGEYEPKTDTDGRGYPTAPRYISEG